MLETSCNTTKLNTTLQFHSFVYFTDVFLKMGKISGSWFPGNGGTVTVKRVFMQFGCGQVPSMRRCFMCWFPSHLAADASTLAVRGRGSAARLPSHVFKCHDGGGST